MNYAIVNFASFVIPMACLWVTRNVFDWSSVLADNVAANVVGAVLAMLFRFWAFRRFVFKRHVVEFHGAHDTLVLGVSSRTRSRRSRAPRTSAAAGAG